MKACKQHDWRLISETPVYDKIEQGENESDAYFKARLMFFKALVGWRRRWYCTRCRKVDETAENAA